jgi:hypothetical protein
MKKDNLIFAKKIFLITILSFIVLFIIGITIIFLLQGTPTEFSKIVGSSLLATWGILPPVISIIGYYIIIKYEKTISKTNLIGILLSCFLIFFWTLTTIYIYYPNILGTTSPRLITIIGLTGFISLLLWFGLLFDRFRYLQYKLVNRRMSRLPSKKHPSSPRAGGWQSRGPAEGRKGGN